ncbi:hypothetical protein [Corynebacterium aquatimens]|uniref:Uncharacterized protein YukE n=1 Tax=Corynebacterium aquatimens TaxID=1190508 RepID=A0A931DVN3_9CORY|nr:hypothetical protein [Corynebacterium aquatimens]MBG6122364.1 uncharacterized protein YukE [Corynebacterium aquatimens]WJY65093.1 hypothetical protein CAQUA_01800 [Corynebacterium aquatimens]
MGVDNIQFHVDNFVNTWNGWYHFLNGLIQVIERLIAGIGGAKEAGDNTGAGAKAFFDAFSSTKPEGLGNDRWPL